MRIPGDAREILEEGVLCYLAAPSKPGPHTTPVVFVLDGTRLWGTTSRGTTKARRWREEPVAGGLVRLGGRALTFRGRVTLYDGLDPRTWPASMLRAPQVARASARFTVKNARFFAGYARDAARVPFSWTPPGRVVFSIDLDCGAVLEEGRVGASWGSWGDEVVASRSSAPPKRPGLGPEDLPEEVADLGGDDCVVAFPHPGGPVVLPARGGHGSGGWVAELSRDVLSLAGARPRRPAAFVLDEVSAWRAARMKGVMLRGSASIWSPSDGVTRVRVVPRTAVWWSGWSSGTVRR